MTSNLFINLTDTPIKGFDTLIPDSVMDGDRIVCFIASDIEEYRKKAGHFSEGISGIILTPGKIFSNSRLNQRLWHITYPIQNMPIDVATASCFLSMIFHDNDHTIEKSKLETNYRSIFNATNEAIFIHDALTGRILDVNDRMLEMFGYTYDEAVKCDIEVFSEGNPPYSQNEAIGYIRKTLEEGPQVFDWMCRRKDGTLFFSEVSLKMETIGKTEKIIAVTRDISDRKKAEEALRESEEKFRSLAENSQDFIVRYDRGFRLIYANPSAIRVSGKNQDGLIGKSHRDLGLDQKICEMLESRIGRVFETGLPDGRTFEWGNSSGLLYLDWKLFPEFDFQGNISSVLGVARDISDLKKTRDALDLSERLFRAYFELGLAGMSTTTTDRRWVHFNDRMCEILGYARDEIGSIAWDGITDPEDLEVENSLYQKVLAGESDGYSIDKKFYRKDGSLAYVHLSVSCLRNQNHEVEYFVAMMQDITERKMAEEALSESEERLRSLMNALPDIVCFKDGDGKWLEANDFYIRLLGLEGVDYHGKSNSQLAEYNEFFRDTLKIRDDSDEKTWELGVITRKDEVIPKPDGSVMVFDNIKIPMFYPDGRRRGLIKVGRDITERKSIEEMLIQSQLNFETFFETVSDLIFVLDARGCIIHINGAVTKRLDFSEDELIGTPMLRLLASKDDNGDEFLKDKILLAAWHGSDVLLRSKKGFEIEVETVTFRGEWNSRPSIFWVSRDISELRLSEKKFATAFNSNSAVMAISTVKDGVYLDVNDTFLNVAGYTRDEVIGKSSLTLNIFDDPSDREEIKRLFLENGMVRDFEAKLRAKDGRTIHGILSMDRFYLGDESCWLTVMTDMTDRRKAEAEKLEMERRLLHAQKLESLGVLAGGIAHDFNNLLTGILGNLDLALLSIPHDSKSRIRIEHAIQASYRAEELTRQMLAYSGKGRFEIKHIDISRVVKENAELFRASIARTVSLDLSIEDGLPFIEADPGQIQQVVMNLITNAAEAIGGNPGRISLSTGSMYCSSSLLMNSRLEEKPDPGKFVFIQVKDNGCGMTKEIENRIFEPFFTTKFTGRGLGMAAVLGIIRGHKGAIMLESAPGFGSSFMVLFPEAERSGAHAKKTASESVGADGKMSGTILVVDDEDNVRELCMDFLKVFGFATLEARNGYEALDIFKADPDGIACVVLDLTMPGLDGAGTFRAIRKIKPDQKIILSSGYSEHEATALFANQGLAGFIQKPYRLGELKEKLAQALKA